MNPVLPQLRHNNFFLRAQETEDTSFQSNSNRPYSHISSNRASYGPLIPPGSGIARAPMGNSSSCNDIPKKTTGVQSENGEVQRKQPQNRSNLSALLDQHQRELDPSRATSTFNLEHNWEATESVSPQEYQRTITPSTAIPVNIRRLSSDAETNRSGLSTNDSSTKLKHRRCLSSKELGTLAPPSGSPYSFMLQQKEMIEYRMAERLKQTREVGIAYQASSLLTLPDDCSSSSRGTRLANEARNMRRAEHNRAVTNDLCEIVTDLFIAESKLLNPSQYGVDSSIQREQVLRCVERFVGSLPARYALGAETASEVLLHMRLMAAVRSDPTRPTVHIMNLENNEKWTDLSSKHGRSRRLVTIACADTTGLLEYVTKLLATGGSRVLDADVMLSTDNIALDRFVVEMHGRLRLDKLATFIERFLEQARNKDENSVVKDLGTSLAQPDDSKDRAAFAGTVYYRPNPGTNEVPTPREIQEEIDSAVPLTEVLASGSSNVLSSFQSLHRHLSLPPKLPSALPPPSVEEENRSYSFSNQRLPELLVLENVQAQGQKEKATPETGIMRQRRPLVNRQGNSDLDRVDHYETDDDLSVDYVTLDATGSRVEDRKFVPLIPFDQLMLIQTLGTGRVSTIYRAVWKRLSASQIAAPAGTHILALKVAMVNAATLDTSHVDELRREADIAARLQHPHICDLVGVAADSECFCLAYEFCEGGSLLSLLSDSTRYYEYLPIALDAANGMAYLHSRNVIHRDLKPSNILLTRDHRAKIADFGMSIANTGQELTAETGTYRYMAPEVIRHESYSSNADVYSFGICLWQLISREVPFATMTPIQAAYAVAEGQRPPIPESTPRRLREIISSCWDQDSHKRPSFTYIAMALADYAKMAFSPANVGAQTLQIANEMLANVEGNSTVNVDFTTPVLMGEYMTPDSSQGSNIGLEI